jgi:hypothetical protein
MVSFDVVSLFIKVLVVDSLTLFSRYFNHEILSLYKHVLTSTYFCIDIQLYEQTAGAAMGSPISPVIAIFYVEDFEKKALANATHQPAWWYSYVEDSFVIWPHGQEKITEFLDHLNGINNSI